MPLKPTKPNRLQTFVAQLSPELRARYHNLRGVDPTIDCVFKAILGSEEHKHLLVHFLNAILKPKDDAHITDVDILNPFDDQTTFDDKLSIVDIKARDQTGAVFQVEIQLDVRKSLPNRMLYTSASLLSQQIKHGEDYAKLRPVYSIWILQGRLFPDMHRVHTCFKMHSKEADKTLSDLMEIHVLQLKDVATDRTIRSEEERWLRFLKEGADMEAGQLPDYMDTQEMQEAFAIKEAFIEDEAQRMQYFSRLDARRAASSYDKDHQDALADLERMLVEKNRALEIVEQERAEKEQALVDKEQERAEKEQALVDKEQERAAKEQERTEKEQALAAKEQERAEKEQALAAKEQVMKALEQSHLREERLLRMLKERGDDPDRL